MKKILVILKRHCLDDGESEAGVRRNHTNYGMVIPGYRRYPFNAEACANIARRAWNPPTEVMRR